MLHTQNFTDLHNRKLEEVLRNTGGAGWSGEQGEGLGFHQFFHPKINCGLARACKIHYRIKHKNH